MSFAKVFNELFQRQIIKVLNIFDTSGNAYYTSAMDVYEDGYRLLNEWISLPPNITAFQTKYAVLVNSYPEYMIGVNLQGQGSMFLVRNRVNNYVFLIICSSAFDARDLFEQIWGLAQSFV